MANKKVGRRSILTEKLRDNIVKVISAGNYANVACQFCGIGESTFYAWIQRGVAEKERLELLEASNEAFNYDENEYKYVEFMEAVKKAEMDAEVAAVTYVRSAMQNNWQAAMTYLERKHPDKWGRRDVTKNVNVNLDATETMDLSQLSDEELINLEALMLKAAPGEKSIRH